MGAKTDSTTRRGRLDEGKRPGLSVRYLPSISSCGKNWTLAQGAPVTQNNMTRNILRGNIHFRNFFGTLSEASK